MTNRWCDGCGQEHGPLYVCESYPPEMQARIRAQADQHRTMVWDERWAEGKDPTVVAILRAFAGEPIA